MWDPFRDVDRLLNGLSNTIGNAGGPYALFSKGRWMVAANVVEDNKQYTVEVDVPGMKKEDVTVRVEDNDNRICIGGNRARPPYQRWIEGRNGGNGDIGSQSFFNYESTVTTIDENGKVTSTTTANTDNNKNKNNNDKHSKEASDAVADGPNGPTRPLLIEKDFGEFERCFTFPSRILRETTTAELSDGVLTLTVDKAYPTSKGSGQHNVTVRGK